MIQRRNSQILTVAFSREVGESEAAGDHEDGADEQGALGVGGHPIS